MCEFAVDPGLPHLDLRNRVGRNLEGVRAQNDEVGPLADRDAAKFCFTAQRTCTVERVSLQCLVGGDAECIGAELMALTRHTSDGCLNCLERLGLCDRASELMVTGTSAAMNSPSGLNRSPGVPIAAVTPSPQL